MNPLGVQGWCYLLRRSAITEIDTSLLRVAPRQLPLFAGFPEEQLQSLPSVARPLDVEFVVLRRERHKLSKPTKLAVGNLKHVRHLNG